MLGEMMDKKPVPTELIEVWDDYAAATHARDKAVKGYFKFQLRNAMYFGRIAEQKRREFWAGISNVYPEFAGKHATFHQETCEVSCEEEE